MYSQFLSAEIILLGKKNATCVGAHRSARVHRDVNQGASLAWMNEMQNRIKLQQENRRNLIERAWICIHRHGNWLQVNTYEFLKRRKLDTRY